MQVWLSALPNTNNESNCFWGKKDIFQEEIQYQEKYYNIIAMYSALSLKTQPNSRLHKLYMIKWS